MQLLSGEEKQNADAHVKKGGKNPKHVLT